MDDSEVKLLAETTGAVVSAIAEQSGVLAPIRAVADYVTRRVGVALAPRLAARAQVAAEKIAASGFPLCAAEELSSPLIASLLEGMALEDDPELQRVWENLLANAATEGSADVRRAFANILAGLDPSDVKLLDHYAQQTSESTYPVDKFTTMPGERDGVTLDNLVRQRLLAPTHFYPGGRFNRGVHDDAASITGYVFTELGWAFVKACQTP